MHLHAVHNYVMHCQYYLALTCLEILRSSLDLLGAELSSFKIVYNNNVIMIAHTAYFSKNSLIPELIAAASSSFPSVASFALC